MRAATKTEATRGVPVETLEVSVFWDDQVVSLQHVSPPRDLTVGEGGDFVMDGPCAPLVVLTDAGPVVVVPPGAVGELERAESSLPSADRGRADGTLGAAVHPYRVTLAGHTLPLTVGSRVTLRHAGSPVTMRIAALGGPLTLPHPSLVTRVSLTVAIAIALTLLAHSLVVLLYICGPTNVAVDADTRMATRMETILPLLQAADEREPADGIAPTEASPRGGAPGESTLDGSCFDGNLFSDLSGRPRRPCSCDCPAIRPRDFDCVLHGLGSPRPSPTIQEERAVLRADRGIDPVVVRRILRMNYGRFRLAYERGLRDDARLAGHVRIEFVIGPDGNVVSARDAGSDLRDTHVVSTIARDFTVLSFPQPTGGRLVATYSMALSPGPVSQVRGGDLAEVWAGTVTPGNLGECRFADPSAIW